MPGIADATGVAWRNGDFYDHVLTDWYEETVVDSRNNVTAWYDMIQTNAKNVVGGKFIVWPVRTTRNEGTGYMDAEEGFLPDPGAQGFDNFTQHMKDFYGRIKISGKSMRQAEQDRSSYLDLVDTEMSGVIEDAKIEWQQAVWNDGSGRYAQVTTVGASGDLTLELSDGVNDKTTCDTAPTKWLRAGMRLMFVTAAGVANVTLYIVTIDSDTNITVDPSPTGSGDNTGVVAGDWACKASRAPSTERRDSSYRRACMGLEGMLSDVGVLDGNGLASGQTGSYDETGVDTAAAGFQGILATAAFPWNQGIVLDNGGTPRDISDTVLQQAFSDAEEQNNANIKLMLCSYPTYNSYITTFADNRRWNNTMTLSGGHKALDFNGVPFYKDKDAYKNRVYFLDMSQITRKEVSPLEWLNKDGSIWRNVTDKDHWEAAFVVTSQLVAKMRQRVGALLTDLNA